MDTDEPIRDLREYWTCWEVLANAERNDAAADPEIAQAIDAMRVSVARFEGRVMSQLFDI